MGTDEMSEWWDVSVTAPEQSQMLVHVPDTVLVVEDLENDVFFLRHALKKAKIDLSLQVVTDGQMAIDYLSGSGLYADRRAFPLPNFIFLDLKLPQVHGLDVLQWIRQQERLAQIIVIILSDSGLEEDVYRAYRLGANSYLVKPNDISKLAEIFKDLSNWWFKHDRFLQQLC